MKKNRYLDGKGKGKFLYDYVHDILTFKIRDRDYKMSFEFENFIVDIDTKDFITGIRIFDASKVSGLKRIVFKNLVHGDFKASIKDKIITVRLNFVGKLRNKIIPIFAQEKNFTQQFSTPIISKQHISDSEVVVPEISC